MPKMFTMRPAISLIIAVMMLMIAMDGCKKKIPEPQQLTENLPYPTLSQQRTALASKPRATPIRVLDSLQIINDLQYLASDTCEGRKPRTTGHIKAGQRILARMRTAGLDSFDNSLIRLGTLPFDPICMNMAGWVKGTTYPDKFIVLTAHYDHLGKVPSGPTYYGTDDNASGVACLLAMAKYFKANPHPYSLMFVALDQEESGLLGAYDFVNYLQKSNRLLSVKFNLNMDMIARSDNNEIYACGIKRYPAFKYAIDEVQNKTNVKLLMGHDGGSTGEDWTASSDHGAFHKNGIPFIYIGVEDHIDYHKPTDTYSRINLSRYIENCNMIALMVQALKP